METTGDNPNGLIESEMDVEDNAAENCSLEPTTDACVNLVDNAATERFPLPADVISNVEPYVGMEFESLESARSFYTAYARRLGFETRIAYSHRSRRDKKITAQQYVCGKESFYVYDKDRTGKRTQANGGVACKASLTVKRAGPNKWVVKQFEKDHDHAVLNLNELQHGVPAYNNIDAAGLSNIQSSGVSTEERTASICSEGMSHEAQGWHDNEQEEDLEGRDTFVTKRDSTLEPYVGMVFESEVEARAYYNAYARRVGFGTRINYSHRSRRDASMIAQQYVCDKEGFRLNKEATKKRHRVDTRVGCKALLNVRKVSNGIWVVKTFVKEHNHPLVNPSQVQYLRSHRGTPDVPRSRITNLQRGENQALADYFRNMQNDNPSFFYAIQLDEDCRMINAFWTDATSKVNYNYFGDMVTFDTLYLIKKFGISFAPFIGKNHHNQPVLFGCALLTDESESSFVWLFRTWLSAMSGRAPISIVTDQDRTIQAAVSEVFPESQHRFCTWNIERKIAEKLGSVCRIHKNFKEEFQKCVYESSSVDEFELMWESFLDKFSVRKNEWLDLLYEDRRYWAPVYLKAVFFSEMPTNQPSECISSFFDEYVSPGATSEEFFQQYENTLDNLHHKEVEADYESVYTTPNMKTSSPMEKQAASIYTREVFKQFQEELFECFGYFAKKVSEDGTIKTYKVAKFGEDKNCYTVQFDSSEMRGNCSCHMFEYVGILCRHILNVFRVSNLFVLPHHYILKRWTRNAKSRDFVDESGMDVPAFCQQSMTLRFTDLCRMAMKISEEGARSAEGYRMAIWGLQGTMEQVMTLNHGVIDYREPATVTRSILP